MDSKDMQFDFQDELPGNKNMRLQASTAVSESSERAAVASEDQELEGPRPASPQSEVCSNDLPALTFRGHGSFQSMQYEGPEEVAQLLAAEMDNLTFAGYQIQPPLWNYPTTVYVGNLLWWTTDVQVEAVASLYGSVKDLYFYTNRNGKSEGCCRLEFHIPIAAHACKEYMNGYIFNGRPCVVTYDLPQELTHMGAPSGNETNVHFRPLGGMPVNYEAGGGMPMNYEAGGGMPMNYEVGTGGNINSRRRDYWGHHRREGWRHGGQGMANRGRGGRPVRGRGISVRIRR